MFVVSANTRTVIRKFLRIKNEKFNQIDQESIFALYKYIHKFFIKKRIFKTFGVYLNNQGWATKAFGQFNLKSAKRY